MAAVPPVRSGGGWKALFWYAIAAAGVGFAGYVFFVPYQKMQSAASARSAEIGAQRAAAEEATAERDKLRAQVAQYAAADKDRHAAQGKRRAAVEAVAGQLRPALDELGGTVATDADAGTLEVSFPAGKTIDRNGIDLSEAGLAALKILGGAARKENARVRIRARSSSAPPPRELKSLFHTAGEVQAVRAARVMSALEDAGVAPDRVSIVGHAAGKERSGRGRGKKGAASAAPDRLDIEIEPE